MVVEIPSVKILVFDKTNKLLQDESIEGPLILGILQEDRVYFIKVNDFVYTLYDDLPIYTTVYESAR